MHNFLKAASDEYFHQQHSWIVSMIFVVDILKQLGNIATLIITAVIAIAIVAVTIVAVAIVTVYITIAVAAAVTITITIPIIVAVAVIAVTIAITVIIVIIAIFLHALLAFNNFFFHTIPYNPYATYIYGVINVKCTEKTYNPSDTHCSANAWFSRCPLLAP